MDRLLLRPAEAGELLGFSRAKTYQLLTDGTLPVVRVGKSIRVPAEELREWVRAQAASSAGSDGAGSAPDANLAGAR